MYLYQIYLSNYHNDSLFESHAYITENVQT